jgi:GNAT superfamily N-acetyltransferase
MTTDNIRLCEPALTLDAEVVRLYQGAFPAAERESVGRLSDRLEKGLMLCHRTLDEQGQLLCFSMIALGDDFSFLAYMATDPDRRSAGIGSRHLERLLEIVQKLYPTHIGMFFEIQVTNPKSEVLSEQEQTNRNRRRNFYERAGARVICPDGVYLTPHYNDRSKEWEGELMGFEFLDEIKPSQLVHVLEQIYWLCYQLPKDHPLVSKVFEYFEPCIDPQDTEGEAETGSQAPVNEGDTNSVDPVAKEKSPEEAEDNCGCGARRDAISDWLSRVWARIRSLLGFDD